MEWVNRGRDLGLERTKQTDDFREQCTVFPAHPSDVGIPLVGRKLEGCFEYLPGA